jgi:hypothetical protein
MPVNQQKNSMLHTNYVVTEQGQFVIINKIDNRDGISKKTTYRINKNRVTGMPLNFPEKLYNLISELWQKK